MVGCFHLKATYIFVLKQQICNQRNNWVFRSPFTHTPTCNVEGYIVHATQAQAISTASTFSKPYIGYPRGVKRGKVKRGNWFRWHIVVLCKLAFTAISHRSSLRYRKFLQNKFTQILGECNGHYDQDKTIETATSSQFIPSALVILTITRDITLMANHKMHSLTSWVCRNLEFRKTTDHSSSNSMGLLRIWYETQLSCQI